MADLPDLDEYRRWLRGKPADWCVVLASRSALRTLPYIGEAGPSTKAVFRANALARAASCYPTQARVLAAAAMRAGNAAYASRADDTTAYSTTPASRAAYAAAYAAASAGRAADTAPHSTSGASPASNAARAAAYASDYAAYVADSAALERGTTPSALAHKALWSRIPEPVESKWHQFAASLASLSQNWGVWVDWYQSVLTGQLDWGLPKDVVETLYLQLASKDDAWWDRDDAVVNAEIADWLKAARGGFEEDLPTMNAFILMNLTGKTDPTSLDDLTQAFADAGYSSPRSSIRGRINTLVSEGQISRVGRASYQILDAKGEDELPDWDFFLSYSTADIAMAEQIAGIAEEAGYSVFAQFKDIPPGSNFVREMQRGLASSGRFVAVLSPHYVSSDHCQAEWASAYNADPGGNQRKIIPFLIRATELDPLSKQIVHVSLYGLDKQEAREKILRSLMPWSPPTKTASRETAARTASPKSVINADNLLDVASDEVINEPHVDADLPRLPERQRRIVHGLLETLPTTNAPASIRTALRRYLDELDKGFDLEVTYLKDDMAEIQADIDADEDASWCKAGVKAALDSFGSVHEKIVAHYPLDLEREDNIRSSPIDPAVFDSASLKEDFKRLTEAAEVAAEAGIATVAFRKEIERRLRQVSDIESLPERPRVADEDLFVTDVDRITPTDLKKRVLFQNSGFLDSLLQRSANVSTIAGSDAGKTVLNFAKRIVEAIWS